MKKTILSMAIAAVGFGAMQSAAAATIDSATFFSTYYVSANAPALVTALRKVLLANGRIGKATSFANQPLFGGGVDGFMMDVSNTNCVNNYTTMKSSCDLSFTRLNYDATDIAMNTSVIGVSYYPETIAALVAKGGSEAELLAFATALGAALTAATDPMTMGTEYVFVDGLGRFNYTSSGGLSFYGVANTDYDANGDLIVMP